MITVGSITREAAAERFPFLAQRYSGRRRAIKEFTHRDPDFVFWVYPDGRLHNARASHAKNVPNGYAYIVDDEPDYGGFLRGRVASLFEEQLIVVYCREEAFAAPGEKLTQFVRGLTQIPVFIRENALVISDNGDLYGTVADIKTRDEEPHGHNILLPEPKQKIS